MRNPDSTIGPFRERDTVVIRAQVQDNAIPPVAIPGASLVSATMTLYSEIPTSVGPPPVYPIINGRDHVDIKPNINAQGQLTLELAAADMAILSTRSEENHRALIEWVWNVDKRGSWEVRILVVDLYKVP